MITLKEPVALLTDIRANEEALRAIIEDIKKRKIKYIFSLGDSVGLGPNPKECIDMMIENKVINILGNNDYYTFLPLDTYRHFQDTRSASYANAQWTKLQLTEREIEYLRNMPPSIDININGKLIGLCHFPCDVRYCPQTTWDYNGRNTRVFYRTNTQNDHLHLLNKNNPGVQLAIKDPLFGGKTVDEYDDIIFGHYHFQRTHLATAYNKTTFHSLNASGVAIDNKTVYYILSPTIDNYTIKKIRVSYDYHRLFDKLDKIDYPNKTTFEEYVKKSK